jgi:hypothetical protein
MNDVDIRHQLSEDYLLEILQLATNVNFEQRSEAYLLDILAANTNND